MWLERLVLSFSCVEWEGKSISPRPQSSVSNAAEIPAEACWQCDIQPCFGIRTIQIGGSGMASTGNHLPCPKIIGIAAGETQPGLGTELWKALWVSQNQANRCCLNNPPAAVFTGIRRGHSASRFIGSFGNSTAWTSCFPALPITELEPGMHSHICGLPKGTRVLKTALASGSENISTGRACELRDLHLDKRT